MTKHKLFKWVALWLLLLNTLTPFNLLFPIGSALKYAIFIVISLLLFPGLYIKGSMVALLVYTAESLVYFSFGNAYYSTISDIIVQFLKMGSALILIEYILQYDKDYKYTRTALLVSVIATILISIISIPILRSNPEIIRYAYAQSSKADLEVISISSWVISWDCINGIVYLVPPMVFLCRKTYRNNKKTFIFWLFSLIVFYLIVFLSNIATPFIFCTAMIFMGFWFIQERFNPSLVLKILLIGVAIVSLTSTPILVPVIDFAQEHMAYGSTYNRLEEVKETLVFGETTGSDLESRNDLYNRSWALFLESPLIGTSTPELISHHSYMIDSLACHGIIFVIPLLVFFYIHFKKVYKSLNHTRVTYILGVSVFVLFMFIKGRSDANYLFAFFLLPILCRYIEHGLDYGFSYKY